jgi:hypothetical protein
MFSSKKTVYLSVILGLFCAMLVYSLFTPAQSLSTPKTASTPLSQSGLISDDVYISSLTRSYQVNSYGVVIIDDTYIFANNGSSTVGVLQVGLTDTEYNHLIYYEAQNSLLGSLAIRFLPEKINDYSMLQIILDEPLLAFDSTTIHVKTVFKDMLNYSVGNLILQTNTNQYTLVGQAIPISPYFISNYTSAFVLPSSAAQITLVPAATDSTNTQGYISSNVAAFTNASTVVTYRDQSDSLLHFTSVNRIIRVNPLGYITIDENVQLRNDAEPSTSSYTFTVPSDASNLVAMDTPLNNILGLSMGTTANNDGTTNVTFTFAGTSANRPPLNYQNQISFELIYSLPFKDYVTNSLGTYDLMIDLYTTKTNFIADSETVQVQIVSAGSAQDLTYAFDTQTSSASDITFQKIDTNVVSFQTERISISFTIDGLKFIGRSLIFMCIAAALMALYVVHRNRTRAQAPEEEVVERVVPVRELREFVKLYEEKSAIGLDLDKAEEDLTRRKIQKKAYNKLVKSLNDKLKETNEQIKPFKETMLSSDDKIINLVQQLDYNEAEKISVKDSADLLEDRYRRGKLPSKAAYDRLASEFIKRKEAIQSKIDRLINELRAYLI